MSRVMKVQSRRVAIVGSLAVVLAMAVMAACVSSEDATSGLLKDQVLAVDGIERVYDLYVPNAANQTPMPLVILLHANRSSRDDLTGESRAVSPYAVWRQAADDHGVLLLIPQGEDGPDGHAGWNDCRADSAGNPTTDDVLFLQEAIEDVAEQYTVDTDRIFATGTSNGGHMAIRLAQEIPEQLAGIGVVAASMPANSQCESSAVPVSAVFMAGTADPIAPFGGGEMTSSRGEIWSVAASIDYWVARNGAAIDPVVTDLDNLDDSDESTVERSEYIGPDGHMVVLYRIEGGGHAEPSIDERYRRIFERIVGTQNHDIEMAHEMWAMFTAMSAS